MTPRHHPTPDALAGYVAGVLDAGFGLVVGTHVSVCATCAAQVRRYEATSGDALETLAPAALEADALTKMMARLDAPAPPPRPANHAPGDLIARLPLKPKNWIAPGVWMAPVDTPHAAENRVYVLRVAAGMAAANHAHSGAEFACVLSGGYQDGDESFDAGDFAEAHGEHTHQPMVHKDAPCLCLFATEGKLRPRGLIERVVFAYADV